MIGRFLTGLAFLALGVLLAVGLGPEGTARGNLGILLGVVAFIVGFVVLLAALARATRPIVGVRDRGA